MVKSTVFVYPAGRSLYMNLTNRCTNRCSFCIRNNGDGVYGSDPLWLEREPTAEEVLADIEKFNLDEFDEFVFCGYGEPTFRIDAIAQIGKELKRKYDKPIRINTNGQGNLIHNRDITPMFEGAVDIVSVSLNEATNERYVEVCRPKYGDKAFPAIIEFAKKCKPYVKEVLMSVVDSALSEKEIEMCRDITDKIGVKLRVRPYETGKEQR